MLTRTVPNLSADLVDGPGQRSPGVFAGGVADAPASSSGRNGPDGPDGGTRRRFFF
jgi:hypothetical protein